MSVEGIPDPERAAVEAEIAAFEDASERQVSATVGPDGIRPEPRLNEYGVPSRDEVFGTAASPDERLREALREIVAAFPSPPDREMDDEEIEKWYADHGDWFQRLAALAAADREAPDRKEG